MAELPSSKELVFHEAIRAFCGNGGQTKARRIVRSRRAGYRVLLYRRRPARASRQACWAIDSARNWLLRSDFMSRCFDFGRIALSATGKADAAKATATAIDIPDRLIFIPFVFRQRRRIMGRSVDLSDRCFHIEVTQRIAHFDPAARADTEHHPRFELFVGVRGNLLRSISSVTVAMVFLSRSCGRSVVRN